MALSSYEVRVENEAWNINNDKGGYVNILNFWKYFVGNRRDNFPETSVYLG